MALNAATLNAIQKAQLGFDQGVQAGVGFSQAFDAAYKAKVEKLAKRAEEKLAVSEPVPPSTTPVIFANDPSVTVSLPAPSNIAVPLKPVTEPSTVTMSEFPSVSMPSAAPFT